MTQTSSLFGQITSVYEKTFAIFSWPAAHTSSFLIENNSRLSTLSCYVNGRFG